MLSDSMGSVPVAAVRSAVEAAWRPLCVHADAVALSDILEVVARVDRSVSRDGDEMFEDPEGDESGDEPDSVSGSDSGEPSEDEDEVDGSEEEKEIEELPASGSTKAASLGKSNQGEFKNGVQGKKRSRDSQNEENDGGQGTGEEDGEESDGGLDDAAMFRIDKYLAQTFSTVKSGRQVCNTLGLYCNAHQITGINCCHGLPMISVG